MSQNKKSENSNHISDIKSSDLQQLLNKKTQESLKHIALEIKHYSYLLKELIPGEKSIRHSY